MNSAELITQINRLMEMTTTHPITLVQAQAAEFLRVYAGPKSSFYESVRNYDPLKYYDHNEGLKRIYQILRSFLEYVEEGLHEEITPERKAQLDVVSDFLQMGQILLETKGVHPAAPAVLIGATLEEFLRTWVEAESLALGNRKPGLESYSQALRDANLITKQDGKDITSWAGIRNHAAHGDWDQVNDKNRVSLMLEGINLFMRKYSS